MPTPPAAVQVFYGRGSFVVWTRTLFICPHCITVLHFQKSRRCEATGSFEMVIPLILENASLVHTILDPEATQGRLRSLKAVHGTREKIPFQTLCLLFSLLPEGKGGSLSKLVELCTLMAAIVQVSSCTTIPFSSTYCISISIFLGRLTSKRGVLRGMQYHTLIGLSVLSTLSGFFAVLRLAPFLHKYTYLETFVVAVYSLAYFESLQMTCKKTTSLAESEEDSEVLPFNFFQK